MLSHSYFVSSVWLEYCFCVLQDLTAPVVLSSNSELVWVLQKMPSRFCHLPRVTYLSFLVVSHSKRQFFPDFREAVVSCLTANCSLGCVGCHSEQRNL